MPLPTGTLHNCLRTDRRELLQISRHRILLHTNLHL